MATGQVFLVLVEPSCRTYHGVYALLNVNETSLIKSIWAPHINIAKSGVKKGDLLILVHNEAIVQLVTLKSIDKLTLVADNGQKVSEIPLTSIEQLSLESKDMLFKEYFVQLNEPEDTNVINQVTKGYSGE